ncbi:MAG TPA: acyl-CoA thioesterase [Candidatus Yaniella excrementavium]|nr:acyl-CoA thioesterase [Candidatus Yaniella excrementavium]
MHTATIRPRLDDLGPVGHIHNTVLPAWFQQARQELLDAFYAPQTGELPPLLIKEYTVTFHRELTLTPDVEVSIEVERIGNTSFTLHEFAYQSGELSAESQVVYIFVGPDGRPAPIPEDGKVVLNQHKTRGG